MTNFIQDIIDFHEKMSLDYSGPPREIPLDLALFRARFMEEEIREYMDAVDESKLADQLDALIDLVYVAIGTAYMQGFDFNEAWKRVHAANMTKVRGPSDRHGLYDVIKPENFVKPDLSDLVK